MWHMNTGVLQPEPEGLQQGGNAHLHGCCEGPNSPAGTVARVPSLTASPALHHFIGPVTQYEASMAHILMDVLKAQAQARNLIWVCSVLMHMNVHQPFGQNCNCSEK